MATQNDVHDLLRLLTTGRNKIPMLAAIGRVQELRDADLHSISSIASCSLPTLKTVISDEKIAKSLLAACKAHVKTASSTTTNSKRPAADDLLSPSTPKRTKSIFALPSEPLTPAALEASLALPQPSQDEEAISNTTVYTNRAPLVLAFAVQLLKYTMPEQPLSGRLSLAQAVVSANSRSKAVSLGIEKAGDNSEWGTGQPKVRIMGREVAVLKRGGYEWKEGENDERDGEREVVASGVTQCASSAGTLRATTPQMARKEWTVSEKVSSKGSTFVARSMAVSSQGEAKAVLRALMQSNPELEAASHNMTAFRVQGPYGLVEDCNDDGESGGGRHILGVLKENNIVDVLLVVTRWYGGVMLGPDRWRIMSQVSRDALSQRLRVVSSVGQQDALWGLDLDGMSKNPNSPVVGGGMPIHRPEDARTYILKAFPCPEEKEDGEGKKRKRKTAAEVVKEKEENLGLLLGALDLLFASWADHLGKEELDRRAWNWYVTVRPEVAAGVGGWGGKGPSRLEDILKLRRVQS